MVKMENQTYELQRQADALLKQSGLTIWGRSKHESEYQQYRFEQNMQNGAYGRSSESGRKK